MPKERDTEDLIGALNRIPPAIVPYDHPVRESVFALYQTLRMERASELLERRREVAEKMHDLTRTLWSFSTIPDETLQEGELKEAEHQLKLTELQFELQELREKLKTTQPEKQTTTSHETQRKEKKEAEHRRTKKRKRKGTH
jgi:hypothetical protein